MVHSAQVWLVPLNMTHSLSWLQLPEPERTTASVLGLDLELFSMQLALPVPLLQPLAKKVDGTSPHVGLVVASYPNLQVILPSTSQANGCTLGQGQTCQLPAYHGNPLENSKLTWPPLNLKIKS